MKKEHEIIMLPSQTDSPIALESSGLLKFIGTMDETYFNQDNQQGQHLYILSDEDIKKGDWFINLGSGGHPGVAIYRANSENSKAINEFKYPEIKKIIATTDPELHYNKIVEEDMHMYKESLPHIPQHIIEAYVKKPFDKVMVEYEEKEVPVAKNTRGEIIYDWLFESPKLNQDGTLAVTLVEEKMYTLKDIKRAFHAGHQWATGDGKPIHSFKEWVKENL